jgi:hypothetical protein
MGDWPNTRPLPTHRTTQHREMQTHIHARSRIQICNLNIQATEDSTCLRPLGYWDRPFAKPLFVNLLCCWSKQIDLLVCVYIPFSVAMFSSSMFVKLYMPSKKALQIYIILLLSQWTILRTLTSLLNLLHCMNQAGWQKCKTSYI